MEILRIAVSSPLYHGLDYLPFPGWEAANLTPGTRIKVPFRSKTTTGILLGIHAKSAFPAAQLKTALEVLDPSPVLPAAMIQLLLKASDYYQYPIGEVLLGALPTPFRQGNPIESLAPVAFAWQLNKPDQTLNPAQQQAIAAISAISGFKTFLLNGVTGSGKTEVYLQAIETVLAAGKQALVLVPEIGLTPQTIQRFEQRFAAPIVLLHSNMTEKARAKSWLMARTGQAAIVIGTRSAIFTPLQNPGIIILDEEHDLSFKQQSGFRYSAKDLAILRGQIENIPVILGSATPSLESLHNVTRQHFHSLSLPERAGVAVIPHFQIVDVRNQYLEAGLSPALLAAMRLHLQRNEQVLLFLNRRGFAPTLLCHACAWLAKCHRCDARLTLHHNPQRLFCHHCGSYQKIIQHCKQCNSTELVALGLGTERLETALLQHFPETSIVRIDRDSTRRKGSMQKMLQDIHEGKNKILIGTQMLTKGHHFPDVTLVGIIDVDSYLFSADFRGSERMGQLIIQVAGRAGRAEKPGTVIIQTHYPQHPLLQKLLQQGYTDFANNLLIERDAAQLPPYHYLALLRAEAVTASAPQDFLAAAKELLKPHATVLQILGPMPAAMERKAGKYRAQLWIQAKKRPDLQNSLKLLLPALEKLKLARKVRWSVDVDPLEIF